MMLYQRVRNIATSIAGSDVKMGTALGLNPRTFSGYLKESREHNLWPLLPKILEVYPQVSREWLYFDEGEMLHPKGVGIKAVAAPVRTVAHAPDGGGPQEAPTPIDVDLLQKAIAPIEAFLHEHRQTLSPADKANLFAQSYALLLEQKGHDNVMQRIQQIMSALLKDPV